MSNSPELEILAWVYSTLSGDTELTTTSGMTPGTGAVRAVAVFNNPPENQPVPYIRISVTDVIVLDSEPFEYSYTPTARAVNFMVDVFSDYEPETLKVTSRVQALLQHTEITTPNYHGSTWLSQPVVFFTENIGNAERIYQRGSVRVQARLT